MSSALRDVRGAARPSGPARHFAGRARAVLFAMVAALAAAGIGRAVSAPPPGLGYDPTEALPGGAATTLATASNANVFSQFSANMGFAKELDFKLGNAIFRKDWVTAPASTKSSDGLGPLYNARACQRCHLKDGRGHPPAANWPEGDAISMLLRLSIPPQTEAQRQALASGQANSIPEPTYGDQLQDIAIPGLPAEGHLHIEYTEEEVTLPGGEVVSLRRPRYSIVELGYGPLHPETMISPRIAQQMIGLGLLEAIPEAEILGLADPDDSDSDGISGKPNRVWSIERNALTLGRFGWKAGQPSVLQQSAKAAAGDIGLGSAIVPNPAGDCTKHQRACLDAPPGGPVNAPGEELTTPLLKLTAFYARNLAVPARRDPQAADVLAGKVVFGSLGCASCHQPHFITGAATPDPHLANQPIWPYTDLLLHDMGEGLADGRPEAQASGREWRTAPLWGIGLTETVSGHTFFLHDGRARNLTEAILWHGGEAQAARDGFAALDAANRARLLAFLNSL
jgi:CxxC motif-containing protein (DUF1111 family)